MSMSKEGYMKARIVTMVIPAVVVIVGAALLLPAGSAFAQSDIVQQAVNDVGGSGATPLMSVVKTLVNVFLGIIGALSVVMIIYGGFKYVTSAGEASALTSAKNTILYAVVGLVIAVSAYAISSFVIDTLSGNTSSSNQRTPEEQARYERCGNTPPSSCQ